MAARETPGWSRLFCRRCRRALYNDNRHRDTVTPEVGKLVTFRHDHCGGDVAPSVREAKA